MTDAARAAFEAHAEGYDAERRRLLPCFDAFYAAAVEAVGLSGRPPGRVLDLGAGTGLLAGFVAQAFPAARLTLLDGAGAMLAQARERLGERASYVVGDLADPLPEGPWDAIVSALAIHHLDDPGKRDLFARVRAALAPGGVFVNAEQVAGETPWLDAVHVERHERAARALGTTEAEWAAAAGRMSHDVCATVEDQLVWLRDAGFADAGCFWRDGRFAVLVARAPA
ncbi:MAG: class I SAM-dependent methyltransferase [Solirubrobacteraceae bacterium]